MKAHVAIFNETGAVHVNPTLSVVSVLVRRGYRVTYVTSAPHASAISSLGAQVLLGPRLEFPFNQPRGETLPLSEQYSSNLIDLADRTLPLVETFYSRNPPDIILYDEFAYAGLLMASRLEIPAIRFSPTLAYSEQDLNPASYRTALLKYQETVDAFLLSKGLTRPNSCFIRNVPTIYFYVRNIQLESAVHEAPTMYAGRCAAERPHCERLVTAPKDNRLTILVSASTIYVQGQQYYQMCAEVASSLGSHVILAIGSSDQASSFGKIPVDCELLLDAPQIAALPRADLMIGAGGMATTMEAMYHGVPMVMLTHGAPEAEMYAENAQRHGLGVHLTGTSTTAAELRACVEHAAHDRQLRESVLRMQRIVRRSAGSEDVVNWIEDFLEGRN